MVTQHEGMSITEARNKLTQLPEQLEGNAWAMPLTRYGKPVMALMSWGLFEAITETMDIMGDPEAMANLKMGIQQIEQGEGRPWGDIKAELVSP